MTIILKESEHDASFLFEFPHLWWAEQEKQQGEKKKNRENTWEGNRRKHKSKESSFS